MKRYSAARSSLLYPCSSPIISQDLVYLQMSHHYRRLLNAKSNVDTAPPHSFRMHQRINRNQSHRFSLLSSSQCSFIDEPSPSDMALVDKIVYDDKHRPEVIYRDHLAGTWNHSHQQNKGQHHHDCTESHKDKERKTQQVRPRSTSVKSNNKKPVRAPKDIIDQHREQFVPPDPFKPRILKSNVPSRVRDLKVYHPPRRRSKPRETTDWDIPTQVQQHEELPLETNDWLENQTATKPDVEPPLLCSRCGCNIKTEQPSSKVSIGSRDSAYNGGVSSGGESRGPTPEQANLTLTTKRSTSSVGECACPLQSEQNYDKIGSEPISHINRKNYSNKVLTSHLSRKQPKKLGNVVMMKKRNESKKHQSKDSSRSSSYSPGRQRKITAESQSTEEQDPFLCEGTGASVIAEQSSVPAKTWDDVRYAEFSQKITRDILSNDIVSNREINSVFQKHIQENLDYLDMALMQREVELLRVQLGITENSDGSEDSLSHWNESIPLSLPTENVFVQGEIIGSTLSNLLDTSDCPAPCSTQCIGVSADYQHVQGRDLLLPDNTNELELWLMNNTSEHDEKDDVPSVSVALHTKSPDVDIVTSVKEATEDLKKTDSTSLKEAVREIIDEILYERLDQMPGFSNKPMAVNSNSDKDSDNASSLESRSFKFDNLTSLEKQQTAVLNRDKTYSIDESDASFIVSEIESLPDGSLIEVGKESSDPSIRCCFKKRKKKPVKKVHVSRNAMIFGQNGGNEHGNQGFNHQNDMPHSSKKREISTHKRSRNVELSSGSSVEDVGSGRERPKHNTNNETDNVTGLDNDKARISRFNTF